MTDTKENRNELKNAVKLVNEEITRYKNTLEKIANTDDQSPILLEGDTQMGYYCQLMVDPKDVAKILLQYSYQIYRVIGEDAPEEMWDELARRYGLASVCSVDI